MRNGGPAFPVSNFWEHSSNKPQDGMTLRDYFAAAAISGLVNCEPVADENDTDAPARQLAKDAYRVADAMLKERDA